MKKKKKEVLGTWRNCLKAEKGKDGAITPRASEKLGVIVKNVTNSTLKYQVSNFSIKYLKSTSQTAG